MWRQKDLKKHFSGAPVNSSFIPPLISFLFLVFCTLFLREKRGVYKKTEGKKEKEEQLLNWLCRTTSWFPFLFLSPSLGTDSSGTFAFRWLACVFFYFYFKALSSSQSDVRRRVSEGSEPFGTRPVPLFCRRFLLFIKADWIGTQAELVHRVFKTFTFIIRGKFFK